MELSGFLFFNPSPDFRELSILKALSEKASISQEKLARVAGVVPSMINRYVRDFEERGYIVKEGETRRNMKYVLTESGSFRLRFLTLAYLQEMAGLYVKSKGTFQSVLDELSELSEKGFFLYGAGIVGGLLIDVLLTEGIEVISFLDDSPAKQGDSFHGVKVLPPEEAVNKECDGVVVASFRHSDQIVKRANEIGLRSIYVFVIAHDGRVSLKRQKREETL